MPHQGQKGPPTLPAGHHSCCTRTHGMQPCEAFHPSSLLAPSGGHLRTKEPLENSTFAATPNTWWGMLPPIDLSLWSKSSVAISGRWGGPVISLPQATCPVVPKKCPYIYGFDHVDLLGRETHRAWPWHWGRGYPAKRTWQPVGSPSKESRIHQRETYENQKKITKIGSKREVNLGGRMGKDSPPSSLRLTGPRPGAPAPRVLGMSRHRGLSACIPLGLASSDRPWPFNLKLPHVSGTTVPQNKSTLCSPACLQDRLPDPWVPALDVTLLVRSQSQAPGGVAWGMGCSGPHSPHHPI